ncbi:MAG: glycoside hydrolase family 43 protein [Muribaculum sp.]|nr:glycoside hydrolase family 43 protein [Muribaculum sp.]
MDKKLSTCIISASILLSVSGCSASKNGGIDPQSSVAIFDSFSYKGMDDFYVDNPLPDQSSFFNPILPGWYSDPTICSNGEGDYFLATSTFTYVPGIPLFHSRDLVNWKQIGHILTRETQLNNFQHQHVSGGIFAPDLKYNPANKTYYMITTNVGAGNFFVKTQDPFAGEWSDPVYLPEVQGIDPSFFFDKDGRAYIVNNDDAPDGKAEYSGHRTVRIVEFDTESEKCVGERKIIVNKGWRPEDKPIWCEGPHIYNINGTYYLMTAEGGTAENHSEVIYKGKSPFGPFHPWEQNPILTQRGLDPARKNPVTCAGHADMIQAKEGDWWAVFLACRPIDGEFENLGRETFMMPVHWTDDGWPYITRPNENVPMIVRRDGVVRGDDVTFGNVESMTDFSETTLGQEWMTLRGSATEMLSLETNPGRLTIKCADIATADKNVLPFICRRVHNHKYECSTHLTFNAEHAEQQAGIVVMKDETHQYILAKGCGTGGKHIVLQRIQKSGTEDLAKSPLDDNNDSVDLKVVSRGKTYDFYYSTDGGNNWTLVKSDVDARFTSTAEAGGFTGTTVGLYASNKR